MLCKPEAEAETQTFLREELSAVRRQLDVLTNGQASLRLSLEKMTSSMHAFMERDTALASNGFAELPGTTREPTSSSLEDQANPLMNRDSTASMTSMTIEDQRKQSGLPELLKLVRINKEVREEEDARSQKWKNASLLERFELLGMGTKELFLDTMISCFIILNMVFIGISSDHWNGEINVYCFIDTGFALVFFCELMAKLCLHGCSRHFLGRDRFSNTLDMMLVIVDTAQLLFVFIDKDLADQMQEDGIPSASLFRTLRLIRLVRILRLLRHPSFQDLLAMMEGTLSGLSTLGWAIIVFLVVMYFEALLCRAVLGEDATITTVFPYFNSVPQSMYTVFRCSFGDCSSASGTPLPVMVDQSYGPLVSIAYTLHVFFLTIGLFNVISAIFVDSTMARAAESNLKKLNERFADEQLFATRVCTVVRRCLVKSGFENELKEPHYGVDDSMLLADIPREVVDDICRHDQETIDALNDLDIEENDHAKLAGILDPDFSGTIQFVDIVNGLRALRGQPRRSDIVTINLMLRATQEKIEGLYETMTENTSTLLSSLKSPPASAQSRWSLPQAPQEKRSLGSELQKLQCGVHAA